MADPIASLTSDLTAPVNYVLMKGLLSAARKKLPFFNGTLPGELMKKKGSASVKWRRINNLSPVTTALGGTSTGEYTGNWPIARTAATPVISDVTVAIAKYGNHIKFNEEVDLFNVNSDSVALVDTLGANAGESLNLAMEGVFNGVGASFTRRAGNSADNTAISTAISVNDIKYVVNQLNRQSAMKFFAEADGSTAVDTKTVRQSYMGICHVDVEDDVRGLTGFIAVEQYGGYTATYPFEFGAVGGVRWCSTEIIPVTTSVTGSTNTTLRGSSVTVHDVYRSYVFGMEAVGSVGLGNMHATTSYEMYDPKKPPAVELIIKPVGSSGVADVYNEIGAIAWKAWFAGKILNDAWIWKIISKSTAY